MLECSEEPLWIEKCEGFVDWVFNLRVLVEKARESNAPLYDLLYVFLEMLVTWSSRRPSVITEERVPLPG